MLSRNYREPREKVYCIACTRRFYTIFFLQVSHTLNKADDINGEKSTDIVTDIQQATLNKVNEKNLEKKGYCLST